MQNRHNLQTRMALFLIGCIGSRLLLVYIAKTMPLDYLPFLGAITLCISAGFAYIFLNHLRKSGPETLGAPIWWDKLRPIHSLLYLLFSYNALFKRRGGWVYLLIDVIIGFSSFLWFHYTNGDFQQLFK